MGLELADVTVHPSGTGLAQSVAAVLGSPVLTAPASLAELIPSLPASTAFDEAVLPGPRPLEVTFGRSWRGLGSARRVLTVMPMPRDWAERTHVVLSGPDSTPHTLVDTPSVKEVTDWLWPYPKLRDLGEPSEVFRPRPRYPDPGHEVDVEWPGVQLTQDERHDWTLGLIDVLGGDLWGPFGFAVPAVGGNDAAHDPLMGWWVTLFALSTLARYNPNEWSLALDVDESRIAEPLARLLVEAMVDVPRLILHSLINLSAS